MNQANHSTKNPSDDAHLSVASFDMASLGQLEDLFSIGSHEHPAAAPGHNTYNPTNAVHMELQENAKLPTFNLPVDRTNSVAAGTRNDLLDDIIRLSETDVNLTEMFLHSRDRSSMNMNYNSAGALLSHIGECFDGDCNSLARPDSVTSGGSRGFSSVQSPPVPSSVHVPHSNTSPVTSPLMKGQPNAAGPTDPFTLGNQQTPGQQYPYHRSLPLPIPKRLSPETTTSQSEETEQKDVKVSTADDAMTAALATAAAIASHRKTSAKSAPSSKAAKRPKHSHPKSATTNDTAPSKSSPAHYRMGASPASILDATNQRSQFGFGGNHVVPSVPVPPPSRKPKATAPPVAATSSSPANAYERKKQKAKDARVKLNESIERTMIAMSVSGTQSKQRAAQLNTVPPTSTALRTNTLHTMEQCATLVEDAKKWDRPSFVGSAASLIQTLNAQCEALMNEMLQMKKQGGDASVAAVADRMTDAVAHCNDEMTSRVSPLPLSNGIASMQTSTSEETEHDSTKRPVSLEGNTDSNNGTTRKRRRFENGSAPTHANGKVREDSQHGAALTINALLSKGSVLKALTRMLDPRSLVHCSRVSRTWKDGFLSDATWLQVCMDRYGEQSVQQWKEKIAADEHLSSSTSVRLYRDMDAANVKPFCNHEGSLRLGDACMAGKVSAWVSMVERSNGATYRSVAQESDPQMYSSLPVVELRMLIQNTGSYDSPIVIKEQPIAVDASTRRRGEEMKEIHWDERFHKMVLNLDGTLREPVNRQDSSDVVGELCRLNLFEAVILVVHIHARGCATSSKFQQKSNFTKLLVKVNETTVPLVIPFFREPNTPN